MCRNRREEIDHNPPGGGVRCDSPGASEENQKFLSSGSRAGNASGVGLGASPCCVSCGGAVVRINDKKPWPHRCASCKAQAVREYQKAYCARTRKRVDWSNLTCQRCGSAACTVPRRGRPSRWCKDCLRSVRTEQGRARRARAKADERDKPHLIVCNSCQVEFRSNRKTTACAACVKRIRHENFYVTVPCSACGQAHERSRLRLTTTMFCSMECFRAHRAAPIVQCQHCGKDFKRKAHATPWHGKNKFCSQECSLTSRWGESRPRKESSPQAVQRAARRARMTTLKHRCRKYGVPFDPECTREAVCERDEWKCQECGIQCHKGPWRINRKTRKASLRNAEHDHIIPLAWGIPDKGNTFENSQCLCRKCNGRKSCKRGGQLLIPALARP